MADRSVKRSEIWASWVSIQCTQDIFDTLVIKVILASLGVFPIFEKPVSRKQLVIERNRVCLGDEYSVYTVLLTQVVNVILGVIWCISDFRQPCISKTAGRRAKRSEIWVSG